MFDDTLDATTDYVMGLIETGDDTYNDDDLLSYEVHSIFLKELAPELEKFLKMPVTVRTLGTVILSSSAKKEFTDDASAKDSTLWAQNDTLARTLQFVRDSGVEASVEQIQALELFISRRYSEWEN